MDSLQKGVENLSLQKPYKRMQLINLKEEKTKGVFQSKQCKEVIENRIKNIPFNISNIEYLSYYYYNCESIEDYGWGCAWRAIQTSLSFFKNYLKEKNKELNDFDLSFPNLFMSFGHRNTLEKLFMKEYDITDGTIPEYLINKKFAPFETNNGWAEPFIAKLIFSHFNLHGELLLINQWPMYAFAPKEVFNRCITYNEWIEVINDYFQNKNASPIIIDDSIRTLCITGVYIDKETNHHHLLLLDPHVKEPDIGDTGIYKLVLTANGEFKNELNPQPTILGKRLDFSSKEWMTFIPNIIIDN